MAVHFTNQKTHLDLDMNLQCGSQKKRKFEMLLDGNSSFQLPAMSNPKKIEPRVRLTVLEDKHLEKLMVTQKQEKLVEIGKTISASPAK